jgi:hypothetical protein
MPISGRAGTVPTLNLQEAYAPARATALWLCTCCQAFPKLLDKRITAGVWRALFQITNALLKIVPTPNRLLESVLRHGDVHLRDLLAQPNPRSDVVLRRNLDRGSKEVA